MGNVIESFASGFGKSISSLLQGPIDFLSWKSCSLVCGPTLDLLCYVENFCIANLLKLGLILISGYIVLLFIYLSYKLRIFHCIGCCTFKMVRACFAACFYACKHGCHCCFRKLLNAKRRRRGFHGESIGNFADPNRRNDAGSFMNHRSRVLSRGHLTREQRKGRYVKRSLRVRNRKVRVGIFKDYRRSDRHYPTKKRQSHGSAVYGGDHGVRMTRTTRFAHKGRWV